MTNTLLTQTVIAIMLYAPHPTTTHAAPPTTTTTPTTPATPSTTPFITTHTYKTVGDLQIKLDGIRSDDQTTLPVIVWIHGGALINGGRQSVPARLKQPLLDAGFAIISIDYRLAPETQLPQIIEDLQDAFTWINTHGPVKLNIDPNRVGVMGGSAGGYLTLTAGFRAKPRPKALVAFWGYGDLIGPWYSQPSLHPRHNRRPISEKEARAQVTGPPIANAQVRDGNGGLFYQFCRQQGIWPSEVSPWNPHTQLQKFSPYMPYHNVDKDYPPTLLIHGTNDTDVPYQQSVMMAERFKAMNVNHQLISVQGAEHGLAGANLKEINRVYQAAIDFAIKHVLNAKPEKPITIQDVMANGIVGNLRHKVRTIVNTTGVVEEYPKTNTYYYHNLLDHKILLNVKRVNNKKLSSTVKFEFETSRYDLKDDVTPPKPGESFSYMGYEYMHVYGPPDAAYEYFIFPPGLQFRGRNVNGFTILGNAPNKSTQLKAEGVPK